MSDTSASSSLKRDYFWNTAYSLMQSVATVVMLIVVTRVLGIEIAGLYSLAIAVGQQFQTLGMFEVRTYHVTDASGKFTFGTYHAARILTVGAMIIGIAGYAVVSGDGLCAVMLMILVASIRVFDAFEDVYYCELQRSGHLDIAGRAGFWRTFVTTAVFSAGLVVTQNLWITVIATLVASLVAMIVLFIPQSVRLFAFKPLWTKREIRALLIDCLPLALASFISMYLANAPRFGIDRYLGLTEQGIFAILYMPAVAINLLALVVFRPLLTQMAHHWVRHNWSGFVGIVRRGLTATAGAFVAVAIVTYFIGVPILNLVFGKDIAPYRTELIVLVFGGAMNSASVILYYAITTMRQQKLVFVGYAVSALTIAVLVPILIPHYQIMGASIAYGIAMTVLSMIFGLVLVANKDKEAVEQ